MRMRMTPSRRVWNDRTADDETTGPALRGRPARKTARPRKGPEAQKGPAMATYTITVRDEPGGGVGVTATCLPAADDPVGPPSPAEIEVEWVMDLLQARQFRVQEGSERREGREGRPSAAEKAMPKGDGT